MQQFVLKPPSTNDSVDAAGLATLSPYERMSTEEQQQFRIKGSIPLEGDLADDGSREIWERICVKNSWMLIPYSERPLHARKSSPWRENWATEAGERWGYKVYRTWRGDLPSNTSWPEIRSAFQQTAKQAMDAIVAASEHPDEVDPENSRDWAVLEWIRDSDNDSTFEGADLHTIGSHFESLVERFGKESSGDADDTFVPGNSMHINACLVADKEAIESMIASANGQKDSTPFLWAVGGNYDPEDEDEDYPGYLKVPLEYLFTDFYVDTYESLGLDEVAPGEKEGFYAPLF